MSDPVRDAFGGAFGGLDDRCPVCGEVVGEHTIRQSLACAGRRSSETPYHEVTSVDPLQAAMEELRSRMGLEPDVITADFIQAKALVLMSEGPVQVNTPALLHEFQLGLPTGPVTVARVLFNSLNADGMRAYGRLLRDTANGAANAAERAAAGQVPKVRWRP